MIPLRLLSLLSLLALLVFARAHDPYAPFGSPRPPAFPRERLARAGLDEATVARLEQETTGEDLVDLARFVNANSDAVIRERFSAPEETGEETPVEPTPALTYEQLNAETVDDLERRIREWNDAHPDQHLAVSGRKGELIGRLLDAYDGEQEASVQAPADATPEAPPVAEQQLPTAPAATTPEGAPLGTSPAPVAPAGTPETGDASTGAQEPAQTADAAGAGTATTEE